MEGGGVALSSLRPWYHALVFTVDVLYRNDEAHIAHGRVL